MKRILSAVMLLAMCCLLLTGCMCKHEYKDATCTEPTTCTLCGKTQGDPTGHIPSDMVTGELDFDAHTSQSYQFCLVCQESLHSETVDLTSMISGGKFVFTPNQFANGLENYFGGTYTVEQDSLDSGALVSMIYDASGSSIGAIMYLGGGDSLTSDDADSTEVNGMICYWYTEDNGVIVEVMGGILCGCDASLTKEASYTTLSAIINSYGDTYSQNGIIHTVTLNDGDFVFVLAIED